MTKVKKEIEKDFYWNGPDYQPKMCLVCRYFEKQSSICGRYAEPVYVNYPDMHKCGEWEREETKC